MTLDSKKIKKSLDDFEEDRFTDSKDALTGEISKARDEFLKDKLGLKNWDNEEGNTDTADNGDSTDV